MARKLQGCAMRFDSRRLLFVLDDGTEVTLTEAYGTVVKHADNQQVQQPITPEEGTVALLSQIIQELQLLRQDLHTLLRISKW